MVEVHTNNAQADIEEDITWSNIETMFDLYELKMLKWKTADGRNILIQDIIYTHLTHIISYLASKEDVVKDKLHKASINAWLNIFLTEKQKRDGI